MAQYYDKAAASYGPGNAIYEADRELDSLYSALTGRKAFSYNPNSDPLYRSYAERYVQNGRMAMRDTMGQAASLTGGYGSSYAQAAGQQQYDEYLRSLGDVLPELYGMAYRQYSDQGKALQDAYERAGARRDAALRDEATAYRRDRDALADQRYQEEQSYKQAMDSYKQSQTDYSNLVKLISSSGYTPSDAELQAAGLKRNQAEALRQEYLRSRGLLPIAVSGGGGGGGGGTRAGSSSKSSGAGSKTGKATSSGVTGANAKAVVGGRAAKNSGGNKRMTR